ncbi:MAG: membrane protein insertase YidC [Alphaproteobacteria bacterium]|nr:membrane protein insertase YidC [Alphaproteobacteria bacterium]
MTDQRNLILAIVLSALIMLGFQLFFEKPQPVAPQQTTTAPAGAPTSDVPTPRGPGEVPSAGPASAKASRDAALAEAPRVRIETPHLHGSLALKGGRIDDLTLAGYRQEAAPTSPEIVLLSPPSAPDPYYAEVGWVPEGDAVKVPGPDTLWRAEGGPLTPTSPVTLRWDNGQGLRFVRVVSVDSDYMFTITQRVENTGSAPVTLYPYALVSRTGTPKTEGFYILHEGPLGVLDGTLTEIKYDGLREERVREKATTGGWIGITDKYWLTAVVPDQTAEVKARFSHRMVGDRDKYQTDLLGGAREIAPGATAEATSHVFAGAKKVALLDGYEEKFGVKRFDLAIDFGWFYFLTKPFFYFLQFLNTALGNFGLAILAFTVAIKAVLFPLANKSYQAMSKMKKLQPEVQKLQQRFGEDKARLNQELMALYKREKANPVSGCLPVLVQIPIFFALYKVLFVTIEMRHAPFYGWIHDLSAPDPTTVANLFGLIPWTPPAFLMIGVWPLIMGATMFLQQKLNPQPTDPVQAKMFLFLPIVFTFLLASFPAGLVIYWAWSNTLSIIQQWVIMRKMGVKP